MVDSADVVVVGAGLNGAVTALLLHRAGVGRVVLLDSGAPYSAGPREGASSAGAGLLRVHYDNEPETALAAVSMPYFGRWREWCGGEAGWRQTGFLRFVEPDEVAKLRANTDSQVSFGARASVLGPGELIALSDRFAPDGIGAAVYEPDSGTASNRLCTESMVTACERSGVEVRFGTTVTRLQVDASGVSTVHLGDDSIDTRTVVLAAGAGAKTLAASAGVGLPLVARSLTMAEVAPSAEAEDLIAYMDPVTNSWISPRAPNRVIISVGDADNGAVVDPTVRRRAVDRSLCLTGLERVAARVPFLGNATVTRAWRGVDSFSPDGKPIIGEVPAVAGLYLNVAGCGKGHKVAPAIGIALTELITTGAATTVDLDAFALGRLSGPGFPRSGTEYSRAAIG